MIEVLQLFKLDDTERNLGRETVVSFLSTHLERWRDDEFSIEKAIDYVLDPLPGKGGFILAAIEAGELAGILVMLKTGMSEFVPQNLLVYIAVDSAKRGRGIGKLLINKAKDLSDGDIALHVEPDNPARHLYSHLGFGSKYIEMRWKRN